MQTALHLQRPDAGKSAPIRGCPVKGDGPLLVVLGAEVGRRWSSETSQFLAAPAAARVLMPEILQGRAKAAYLRRWSAIVARSAAWAFTISLLDRCRDAPSVEVRPPGAFTRQPEGENKHI